jgi:UDP-N-acetylglucosamine 2-epimerase (non-hydrolysing)
VDAVLQNIGLIKRGLDLVGEKYLLLTLHRPSNVDNKTVFRRIVKALRLLSSVTKLPIVFPIHPRTKKMARLFKIEFEKSVFRVLPPVGYLDMLCLEKNASLILTDSGGIQEEACVLGVPCVTIRDNTERPETVNVGANIVAGTETRVIVKSAMHMIKRRKVWANPFGDGSSAKKIVDILAINNLT